MEDDIQRDGPDLEVMETAARIWGSLADRAAITVIGEYMVQPDADHARHGRRDGGA